jgi:hypothetical protein
MRVSNREIESAIQELNNVIMDLVIYSDSLRAVRDTLEKLIRVPAPDEKVKCIYCKKCIETDDCRFQCSVKECFVDAYLEEECCGFEDNEIE